MDLTGKRFRYLTIIKRTSKNNRGSAWLCKCDCGNEVILPTTHLVGTKNRRGNKSCGCKAKRQNGDTHKHPKLYAIYAAIIERSTNPKASNYKWYGGKSVSVDDEWSNSFQEFYKWAYQNGYEEGLWIERINGDGAYTPENCTWVTPTVQAITKGISSRNKTGVKGVCKSGDRYRAYITINYKTTNLGSFINLEDAIEARKNAEEQYHNPLIEEYID